MRTKGWVGGCCSTCTSVVAGKVCVVSRCTSTPCVLAQAPRASESTQISPAVKPCANPRSCRRGARAGGLRRTRGSLGMRALHFFRGRGLRRRRQIVDLGVFRQLLDMRLQRRLAQLLLNLWLELLEIGLGRGALGHKLDDRQIFAQCNRPCHLAGLQLAHHAKHLGRHRLLALPAQRAAQLGVLPDAVVQSQGGEGLFSAAQRVEHALGLFRCFHHNPAQPVLPGRQIGDVLLIRLPDGLLADGMRLQKSLRRQLRQSLSPQVFLPRLDARLCLRRNRFQRVGQQLLLRKLLDHLLAHLRLIGRLRVHRLGLLQGDRVPIHPQHNLRLRGAAQGKAERQALRQGARNTQSAGKKSVHDVQKGC